MVLTCYTVKSLRNGGKTATKNIAGELCILQAHSPPARFQMLVENVDGLDLAIAIVEDFHLTLQKNKGVGHVHCSKFPFGEVNAFSGLSLTVPWVDAINDIGGVAFDDFTIFGVKVRFADSNNFHVNYLLSNVMYEKSKSQNK